jgi:hypothetical protein
VGVHHIGRDGFQASVSLAEHGDGRRHPVGEEQVDADGEAAEELAFSGINVMMETSKRSKSMY